MTIITKYAEKQEKNQKELISYSEKLLRATHANPCQESDVIISSRLRENS